MSAVLDMILKFANVRAGRNELNEFHLLFGYAQLLSMNEDVLEKLLPADESKKEVNRIREEVRKNDLDVDMMRKGFALILSVPVKDAVVHIVNRDKLKSATADELFITLLDNNSTVVNTFKKGCSLQDVMRLKNDIAEQPKREAMEDKRSVQREDTLENGKASTGSSSESGDVLPTVSVRGEKGIEALALSCKELYYSLKKRIIGQDDAIEIFARGYFKASMFNGLQDMPAKPGAVFLFAGPPGVGKTLLATESARILGRPCLRLDMSEYADSLSYLELIGVSGKFKGASKGKLTSFVADHPDAFVIFDEIEKADLTVIHLFLQLLDAGILQDAYYEKTVSFRDTLLIFTTNAGKSLYESWSDKNLSLIDPSVVLDALKKERHPTRFGPLFPEAICSRFTAGNVVVFNHLSAKHLQSIVEMKFQDCKRRIEEKYNWHITYDTRLPALFLYHQGAKLDARIISSQSYQFIQDEVYEYTRQAVERLKLEEIKELDFKINLENSPEEVRSLFEQEAVPKVAVVSDLEWPEKVLREGTIVYTKEMESLNAVVSSQDISFVLVDPDYGEIRKHNAFSLDDMESKGMRIFHAIREKIPSIPVYLLDRDNRMRDVDRMTFIRQGASGFIRYETGDWEGIAEEFRKIVAEDYLQSRIRELANKGRHLAFNSAQYANEDQTCATVEFYDFKVYTAIDAADHMAVLDNAERPTVTFEDVIGAEDAKSELKYFVGFLKNPKKYILEGAKPPRGILLYGPPGTGKTMLARAMAGEADATFFATNATDFMDRYVGEGESRIRNIFSAARKYAPSIVFIDEIDAIAKERTGKSSIETYLNTLMTEMDGFKFDITKPVFVLAATNFSLDESKAQGNAVIDPAMLRRFDNKIHVDLPNKKERTAYIRLLLKSFKDADVQNDVIENISDRTTGESLANLQNIFNLALRNARKAGKTIDDAAVLEALEEYYYGEQLKYNKDYYDHVAHHEAGHAYISFLSGATPSYVTIVSRGDFGGYMQHAGNEDNPTYTKDELLWRIRISLAGRASEIVFFGEEQGVNTGVSGDLQNATNLALNMICKYGMTDDSLLSLDVEKVLYSSYAGQVLKQAEMILNGELKNTIQLVSEGREKIERLSKKLLAENQLMGKQVEAILS